MKITKNICITLIYSLLIFFPLFHIQSNAQNFNPENFKISALRIKNNSITADGILSEDSWRAAEAITELTMCEPTFGIPASEKTHIKILYDEDNIYVGVTCYYKNINDLVATNLSHRQDSNDDQIAIVFDTFLDRTKGYCFMTNAYGAKNEGYIDGVSGYDENWNDVWLVAAKINDNNWSAEFKIPLRILRFPYREKQSWGFNIYRSLARKNERSYWAPIPPQHTVINLSLAGRITGLKGLAVKRNLQFRPYALAGASKQMDSGSSEKTSEAGFDIKYVPVPNFAFDFTYNTDFAQIESDEEQVNLTRFSLFYPEKRDFFLENSQLFLFGLPMKVQPFFSRSIGIYQGKSVPILYGARLTGKSGKNNIGLLNMTTEEKHGQPKTNYSVIRFRRDVLKNSNMGFIITNQENGSGFNRCWGIDSDIWLTRDSRIRGFYSSVDSREINDKRSALSLHYSLNRDLFQFTFGYINLKENYKPAMGFVILGNVLDYSGIIRKSFRPNKWGIRKINFMGIYDYIFTQEHKEFMKVHVLQISADLDSGDRIYLSFNNTSEQLYEDFNIYSNILIPTGDYAYNNLDIGFMFNERRKLSGLVSLLFGDFYDGTKSTLTLSGLLKVNKHLKIGNEIEYNDVDLPYGNFITFISRWKISLAFTSGMSLKTYIQYNSTFKELSSNIRFHLLHGNDNDLYLVYNNIISKTGSKFLRKYSAAALKLNYRIYF